MIVRLLKIIEKQIYDLKTSMHDIVNIFLGDRDTKEKSNGNFRNEWFNRWNKNT